LICTLLSSTCVASDLTNAITYCSVVIISIETHFKLKQSVSVVDVEVEMQSIVRELKSIRRILGQ